MRIMLLSPTSARQVSEEEKREWINRLAEIYQKQGYKVKGKRYVFGDGHSSTNEILVKICQETGLKYGVVVNIIPPKFKQIEKARVKLLWKPFPQNLVAMVNRLTYPLQVSKRDRCFLTPHPKMQSLHFPSRLQHYD